MRLNISGFFLKLWRQKKLFFCILIPFIVIFEISYHFIIEHRIPTDADWRNARAYLRQHFKQGDLVIIDPQWAELGWVHLGEFASIKERSLADVSLFHRVWIVSIPAYKKINLEQVATLSKKVSIGRVSIEEFKIKKPLDPVYDFLAAFEKAKVTVEETNNKKSISCDYTINNPASTGISKIIQPGRFECKSISRDTYVAPIILTDRLNNPRLCLRARPIHNKILAITYSEVPHASFVRGFMGLHYNQWTRGHSDLKRAPVNMKILVDNSFSVTASIHQNQAWVPFKVTVKGKNKNHSIRYEISSPQSDWQFFCFTGWMTDTEQ